MYSRESVFSSVKHWRICEEHSAMRKRAYAVPLLLSSKYKLSTFNITHHFTVLQGTNIGSSVRRVCNTMIFFLLAKWVFSCSEGEEKSNPEIWDLCWIQSTRNKDKSVLFFCTLKLFRNVELCYVNISSQTSYCVFWSAKSSFFSWLSIFLEVKQGTSKFEWCC